MPNSKMKLMSTGATITGYETLKRGDGLIIENFYDAFKQTVYGYAAPNEGEQFYIEIIHVPTDKVIARILVTVGP